MSIPHTFSPSSKVWVYQSARPFSAFEQTLIAHSLADFAKSWTSHSNQLQADAKILFDRLIVLIVDESQSGASGCSIDSSVKFLKQLELEHNLSLFNRLLVNYFNEDELVTVPLSDFQTLIQSGVVNKSTRVINALVPDLQSLETKLIAPAQATWLSRYFD